MYSRTFGIQFKIELLYYYLVRNMKSYDIESIDNLNNPAKNAYVYFGSDFTRR